MIIVKGDCIGEIYPVRDPRSDMFSHFRYEVSRLNEDCPALREGVAKDMEAAKDAVRKALDKLAGEDG